MSSSVDLDGPIHRPTNGQEPTEAVIMLHGYGADGNDLIGLAPVFAEHLPGAIFYSPHAPDECEISPFGRQWFSLAGYDPATMLNDPERLAGVFEGMLSNIELVTGRLDAFIDEVIKKHDLPANKIALLGFSQGTMLALHVSMRRTQQLGGVLGYSGALLGAEKLAKDVKSKPPVKLIHGDQDEVVPHQAMAVAEAALRGVGIPVTTNTRPGMSHGIDSEGAVRGSRFLSQHLIPTSS